MIKKIKENFKASSPTRYNRVLSYISTLKNNVHITNKRDLEIIEEIEEVVKILIKRIKIYTKFNMGFYCAIYISFLSLFFTDIFLLSEIITLISKIVSVFGTTIFILGIYFSNKIIELHYQDLNLLTAHVISIYTKHQKDTIEELTDSRNNYYKAFIEFFKKRDY